MFALRRNDGGQLYVYIPSYKLATLSSFNRYLYFTAPNYYLITGNIYYNTFSAEDIISYK